MSERHNRQTSFVVRLCSGLLALSLLAGCDILQPLNLTPETATVIPMATETAPVLQAEVVFEAYVPAGTPEESDIAMEILDEVTGLAFNATRVPMQPKDASTYFARVTLPVGTELRYRYIRQGTPPAIEYNGQGEQVRYRLYHVEAPAIVKDIVAGWTDEPFEGETGRIIGQILDNANNAPLPNILVEAGGIHAITASDGSFTIENLPPGIHTLSAMSLAGDYSTFQQGARIDVGATTPAPLRLNAVPLVPVTFNVTLPDGVDLGQMPLRMVGNLASLGNLFADRYSGLNILASRAPILTRLSGNRYSITLQLPVGWDLRYKYTLGDGLFNGEMTAQGNFFVRQLIVPANALTVEDTIASWSSPGKGAVSFRVTLPAGSENETLSIQLNPFDWTAPLPMVKEDDGSWSYTVFNPLHFIGETSFRFCRNDECTVSVENDAQPRSFTPSEKPQKIDIQLNGWKWAATGLSVEQPSLSIPARGGSFLAGVEWQGGYHPEWNTSFPSALDDVKRMAANAVILTPAWTYQQVNAPRLEPALGEDVPWSELSEQIKEIQSKGLAPALYPQVRFRGMSASEWWQSANRDEGWWDVWFNEYRTYALNFADLATQQGVNGLILGDSSLGPALPNGKLPGGDPSNVPYDANETWRKLIADIRSRYSGTLLWAVPAGSMADAPDFIGDVDAIYLLWSLKLSDKKDASIDLLTKNALKKINNEVKALHERFGKPLVLAVMYPSADGAANGCVQVDKNTCRSFSSLRQPISAGTLKGITLDLQEQVNLYAALARAAASHDWITGLVTRGYFPPLPLEDPGVSVHGKPAQDLLRDVFTKFTTQP